MKKIKTLLALLVCSVTLGGFALSAELTASAGIVDNTLVSEDFGDEELDEAVWYRNSKTGTQLVETYQTYQASNAYSGTGLMTKAELSGGATVEVDIKEADWNGLSAQLVFAFGVPKESDNENLFWRWYRAEGSDALYLTYNKDAEPNMIRMAGYKSTLYDIADGTGATLPYRTAYAFADAVGLADAGEADKITNKTLRLEYNADGSFELSLRELGAEANTPFTVIAKSTTNTLQEFPTGCVYLFAAEGEKGMSFLDIRDIRVYDKDEQLVADFYKNEAGQEPIADATADFISFRHQSTSEVVWGAKNALNFTKKYRNNNPVFMGKTVYVAEETDAYESLATLDFTLTVNEMVGDKSFGLLLGAEYQSSGKIGNEKTSHFYIKKTNDGYAFGMDAYAEEGVKTTVIEETALNLATVEELPVRLEMGSKGTLRVYFGNMSAAAYASDNATFFYEGFTGFVTDGTATDEENYIDALLSEVTYKNSYYDRPENTNLSSDFTNDEYNSNLWYLSSTPYMADHRNGTYVKDGQLYFANVCNSNYISTWHKYGNFDMEYSITDLRREPVVTEAGNKIYPISSLIGIVFGAEFPQEPFGTLEYNRPIVYFESKPNDQGVKVNPDTWDRTEECTQLVLRNMGFDKRIDLPAKYDFWDESKDGSVVDVKISVSDRNIKVYVKYGTETDYTLIADETMAFGVSGHIYVWSTGDDYYQEPNSVGANCGYAVLDNIKITNKDENAALTTVEFVSHRPTVSQDDYEYVDSYDKNDYLPVTDANAAGCAGSVSSIVWVLPVLGGAALLLRRKKDE